MNNKQIVLEFYRRVFVDHDAEAIPEYVALDVRQHSAGLRDGISALAHDVQRVLGDGAPAQDPDFAIEEGDLVTLCVPRPRPEPHDPSRRYDFFAFETFRVADGRIVERWCNDAKAGT